MVPAHWPRFLEFGRITGIKVRLGGETWSELGRLTATEEGGREWD